MPMMNVGSPFLGSSRNSSALPQQVNKRRHSISRTVLAKEIFFSQYRSSSAALTVMSANAGGGSSRMGSTVGGNLLGVPGSHQTLYRTPSQELIDQVTVVVLWSNGGKNTSPRHFVH